MSTTLQDIGILGTGLWSGPLVTNDAFPEVLHATRSPGPSIERRGADGTVRIGGLELHPDRHGRTIAAFERGLEDPFRGTRRRRAMPADLLASHAEADAANNAMKSASIEARDVDVLLTQSFLPDRIQPRNAALIAERIGLTRGAAWEVDSHCNSAVSQLQVASALIASGQATHVLCTQSVAYSRVRDPNGSANFLEGDMASAFVVGRSPGARATFAWNTEGSGHAAIRLDWDLLANSRAANDAQTAGRVVIRRNDELQPSVMRQVEGQARALCDEALTRAGIGIQEIDAFITNQPANWFVPFMEDVLGLPEGIACSTFEEYANVGSASIPATLHHARVMRRIKRGSHVLFFSPVAGGTYGAAVIRW